MARNAILCPAATGSRAVTATPSIRSSAPAWTGTRAIATLSAGCSRMAEFSAVGRLTISSSIWYSEPFRHEVTLFECETGPLIQSYRAGVAGPNLETQRLHALRPAPARGEFQRLRSDTAPAGFFRNEQLVDQAEPAGE